MSPLSTSLIIGSIFLVTLSQLLAGHASLVQAISAERILLACGLLYCAMKIYMSWLAAPPPQRADDDNQDQQNEK